MSKPFKLPRAFKLIQKDDTNEIIINQVNPIWIAIFAIGFIGCFFIALKIQSFGIGCVITLGAALYQLFLKPKYIISFNNETLYFDNETIQFSEIRDIRISRKISNAGFGVQTGSAQKVSIQVVTLNDGLLYTGQDLIEEYQHALIFLLKKVVAKDLDFIKEHLTK